MKDRSASSHPRRGRHFGRLAVLVLLFPAGLPASAAPRLKKPAFLNVTNPTPIPREEIIAIPLADILEQLPPSDPANIRVETMPLHGPIETQIFSSVANGPPDTLLALVTLEASQTIQLRFFLSSSANEQKPLVFGRAVPERKDDFAWENDKVAYRVYGPALQATGEITSGIDVWSKRVSDFVINDWYAKDAEGQRTKNPALTYHKDSGEGLDSYEVGPTRGCGGTAIFSDDKFFASKNYTQVEILAAGPIRFQFRLHYAPWQAGSVHVGEVKTITLDAGTHMNRIQSVFSFDGAHSVQAAVGLAIHPEAQISSSVENGLLAIWEPLTDPAAGMVGTGIVLPPGAAAAVKQGDGSVHLVVEAKPNVPILYYAGAAWSKSDIGSAAAWRKYLQDFSFKMQHPVQAFWY
ncbi:MAG: DUF4861 family protein [Candidatus Acidiferrales bacterium]